MGDIDPTVFVFRPFQMDPAKRMLSRDGQSIALTPKEFDTLLVLLEAQGSVVDKEELTSRYGQTAMLATAAWRETSPCCAKPLAYSHRNPSREGIPDQGAGEKSGGHAQLRGGDLEGGV